MGIAERVFIGALVLGSAYVARLAYLRATEPAQQVELETVTAERYFADYKANEVAADQRYLGKRWAVTGTITRILKSYDRKPLVVLAVPGAIGVMAGFVDDDRLADAHIGERVRVVCVGAGEGDEIPALRSCTLD